MTNGKKLLAVSAAAALILTGIGGFELWKNGRPASVVQLDVNPSIELQVDKDGDVLKSIPLNADAEEVLEGMKLKGADADTAVSAILGSLLRHGYIDEAANSILLTVEDEDKIRGAKLREELTEEINDILNATAVHAAVLSQEMKETTLAQQENISEGKATLIQNIVDANETYKADELVDLSVNELNLIASNSKNNVKNVEKTGSAAESAYIGRDKVKETVIKHAGVKEADVRDLEIEMDYEYKTMIYEVEFSAGQYEYDYSVDAKSGEILHSHREYDDDYVVPASKNETKQNTTSSSEKEATTAPKKETATASEKEATTASKKDTAKDIGKEKAKSIAFSHAGVKESEVSRVKVEREYDDGRLEYQVEFQSGNKEYDYEINGSSGIIIDYDVEVEDRD